MRVDAAISRNARLAERTAMNHVARLHARGDVERSGEGHRSSPYTYHARN